MSFSLCRFGAAKHTDITPLPESKTMNATPSQPSSAVDPVVPDPSDAGGASATVGIQIVQPWELVSCKCPIVSRRIQVPGETRQRCFECLKPCNNDITICAHASDAANIANSPAAANAGRPGDDGPPLAALPNGTTADVGLEHSNVTPLAEESQRSLAPVSESSVVQPHAEVVGIASSFAADRPDPTSTNLPPAGDDGPPLAALPNGTTEDAALQRSNVTPLAEKSQRSLAPVNESSVVQPHAEVVDIMQNMLTLGSDERRVFKLLSDQVREETRRDQGECSRTSLLQHLVLLTDEQVEICIDSWNKAPGEADILEFVLSKNRYIAELEARVKQLEQQVPMVTMKMRIPLDVVYLVDSEDEDGPMLEDLVKDQEQRPDEAGREEDDLDSVSGKPDGSNPGAGSDDGETDKSVFCPDCEITLNSETQWDDHKIGKKHKRNVKKNLSGQAACCDPSDGEKKHSGKGSPPLQYMWPTEADVYRHQVAHGVPTYSPEMEHYPWTPGMDWSTQGNFDDTYGHWAASN